MQLNGQNPSQITSPITSANNNYYTPLACACPQGTTAVPAPSAAVQNSGQNSGYYYQYPQYNIYPDLNNSQQANPQPQVQTLPQSPQGQEPASNSAQTYNIPANSSGVTIQIFNPSVATPGSSPSCNINAPSYNTNNQVPQNTCNCSNNNGTDTDGKNTNINDENNSGQSESTENSFKEKKTEERQIIQLTDEYIKALENYLNSPNKELRIDAAHKVYARLKEDPSRKDDKALNALVNKMLQDPSAEVRVLAFAALDGRYASGDDFTVELLKKMQSSPEHYAMDAPDAAKTLLTMMENPIKKELPKIEKTTKTTTKTTKSTKTETNKG